MKRTPPHHPRSSRRYWPNIARFLGICLITAILILFVYVGRFGVTLAADALYPARLPVEGTPGDMDIASHQEISFLTADGLTLHGWYTPSENGAAAILAHGHGANRASMASEAWILARHGYGVLMFDFRAHGESEGDIATLGEQETLDLEAALDFVAAQPDVDPERISALGFSMGAVTVAEVAARNPQIRAVVTEAPFPTLRDEVRFRTHALPLLAPIAIWWGKREAGTDVDSVRPVNEICNISPRPVLLIYGTEDKAVLPDGAQQMFAAACEPKTLWLIEGAGHGAYHQVVGQEYENRLIAFFDESLRSKGRTGQAMSRTGKT